MARKSPSRQNNLGKRNIVPKGNLKDAVKIHNDAKASGKLIPHFKDGEGKLHYIDRRGKSSGGGQYFRNLGGKLKTEAGRRATKLGATPTKAMYIEEYGTLDGTRLYDEEQKRLKNIYDNTPSATHDVDHINSLNDGGVHHSGNLRMQNSGNNRSDGARGLSKGQKNAIMLADDPKNQIKLQGPKMKPRLRQSILRGSLKVPKPINMNGFRGMTPLTEYGAAVDEITGGHADRFVQQGVNKIRMMIGLKPNKIRNNYR